MRKLLSTDIDGTILFNATISRADLEAMARWRDAGHLLVPNTGRSVAALRSALGGPGLDFDYSVLYTGAALTGGDYDVLEARTLPDGLAEEVLDLLEGETGVTVFATTLEGDLQLLGDRPEAFVAGPQAGPRDHQDGADEVDVNQAEAATPQPSGLDEVQQFVVVEAGEPVQVRQV